MSAEYVRLLVYTLSYIVSSSTLYVEKSSDNHIKKVIVLLVAESYPTFPIMYDEVILFL